MFPAVMIHGTPWLEAVIAVGIVALAVAVAFIVNRVAAPIVGRFTARTATTLDDLLLAAVKAPLAVFIVVQGLFTSLTFLSALNPWQSHINKAWIASALVVAFWAIQRIVGALLTWYGQEVAHRTRTNWDEQFLPVLRRVLGFSILAIGVLVVLGQLGVSISPLLAGLGIGGLAVALALQPTLSNFISGTFVLSDGSIRPGDFIEVQGGPSGTVTEVGWRITRLRSPTNNIVTIPNSKLADSIVTNYEQPEPAVNVWLTMGVSYESDLERVEQTCLDVAKSLLEESPHADQSFQPVVYFREFADSNINFFVVMRAKNRAATFGLQHQMVKSLHQRFGREGIEISYPVRKLVLPRDGVGGSPSIEAVVRSGDPSPPPKGTAGQR